MARVRRCGIKLLRALIARKVVVILLATTVAVELAVLTTPADENGENGLGFTFQSYNGDDLLGALKRCLNLYNHNRAGFQALQYRDMSQDFSWNVPAGRYMELFRQLCNQ